MGIMDLGHLTFRCNPINASIIEQYILIYNFFFPQTVWDLGGKINNMMVVTLSVRKNNACFVSKDHFKIYFDINL